MSLDNLFIIVQQTIAIIIAIVVLYLLNGWLVQSLEFEEQRKFSLNVARQVRRRAFQSSTAMLRAEYPSDERLLSELGKLEEQDGIK